ncbi:MAG TPA: hypothetical protein VJZ27_17300 [Aggregatilineales bacterium]|nr:hypothetical protein [Aggregatilineales bacterium]
MTDWNGVTGYFLDKAQHPRHRIHAREMYNLLLGLRELTDFHDLDIRARYLYVTISPGTRSECVVIHNEEPGYFTVSLYNDRDLGSSIEDEYDVPAVFVPSLIRYFLKRINTGAVSPHI